MWLKNQLLCCIPEAVITRGVFKSGVIVLPEKDLFVARVLFDSGALHASYVSKRFIDKFRHMFYIEPIPGTIMLADNITSIPVEGVVAVKVRFQHDNDAGESFHEGVIRFVVFETNGPDIIIGLPHILQHFLVLFGTMLLEAQALLLADYPNSVSSISIEQHNSSISLLEQPSQDIDLENSEVKHVPEYAKNAPMLLPWSNAPDEIAPEEANTPDPCSFRVALQYMENSYDESMKIFLDQFDEHIDENFRRATPIERYLKEVAHVVFVPKEWTGLKGIKPLHLEFAENMPKIMKPPARHINPRLMSDVKTEFDRLRTYFYRESSSDIASPLVVAPKATKPFIRFCGDYVKINKYILDTGHYPIPRPMYELEKMRVFVYYGDIDWANSYHQVPIDFATGEKLSVQTPFGQVAPTMMPEGIPPATGKLQHTVHSIFAPFEQFTVCIFDNILVGGRTYEELYDNIVVIINRCIEFNIILKMGKSWFGRDYAEFFGYTVRHGSISITEKRKTAITSVPFPSDVAGMRRFLGQALYCKSWIPGYSDLTAKLNETLRLQFQWNAPRETFQPYIDAFNEFKAQLVKATALFYPDYSLEFIVRTDASRVGVSAALFQVFVNDNGSFTLQPITFASQKLSDVAVNWSVIEQECYALKFGVDELAYYLRGKHFTLECDHDNLRWLENSSVPKLIRWRMFLQSFHFTLRHIPGKMNKVADWLSRIHCLAFESFLFTGTDHHLHAINNLADGNSDIYAPADGNTLQSTTTPSAHDKLHEMLTSAHGGREGHWGVSRTCKRMMQLYPGHRIPVKMVTEFINNCSICQKERLTAADGVTAIVRHLKPPHNRCRIGIDDLSISPVDKNGNGSLTVIVNHYSKHVFGYASPPHPNEIHIASALFQYYTTFGRFDEVISDPASNFTAAAVKQLNQWLSVNMKVSLVDRHESNGVEGTNKSILRHLRCLCADERVVTEWSSPSVLHWIFYLINSSLNSETGIVPFHAMFGDTAKVYMQLNPSLPNVEAAHEFVRKLNDNFVILREISDQHQRKLISDRLKDNPPLERQNMYQPNELVLVLHRPDTFRITKLHLRYDGPFKVISHSRNDVTVESLIDGKTRTVHSDRCKLYFGTEAEAYRMAQLDNDQYCLRKILAYKGDVMLRTTMSFEVEYEDGDISWVQFSQDIYETVQYENYVKSIPELYHLQFDAVMAKQYISTINAQPITEIELQDTIYYVNLRTWGEDWYQSLNLPDMFHIVYVMEIKYVRFNKQQTKVICKSVLTGEVYKPESHWWVKAYGTVSVFDDSKMVLVNAEFVTRYPAIIPETSPIE